MEESEYKSTYRQIVSVACRFEKALTNHRAKCSYASHFCLADREGYVCKSEKCAVICGDFLQNMRENSRFTLKLKTVGKALPHNMEIRVQAGGLLGLQQALSAIAEDAGVEDVRSLISTAIDHYGSLDALPYTDIVQSVAQFQGRKRRQRRDL